MKTFEATVAADTTINFLTQLGGPAKRGGSVSNLGDADFRIRLTLGASTRQPMTIPTGVRWIMPSNVDQLEVLPGPDGAAWYQLLVTL